MNIDQGLEKNFVSAVVYVHDDEKQISSFMKTLYDQLSSHFEKFEIIMVNDASTDGSEKEIRKFAAGLESSVVSILKMSYFQGTEMSMNAGKRLSIGDYVFEFDTMTMDYTPELIFAVYQKALTGFDIVSARARKKGKWTSRIFYGIFNRFSKVQYKIGPESFRVLSRRGINRIDASCTTILYRKAVYANCGLCCAALSYEVVCSTDRELTKHQKKYREELAIETLILHTDMAYRISMGLTALMMAVTLFVLIYTIVIFAVGDPVTGWTTTMLVLSFGFFGMFAILSVVIRYLAIILDLSFKRRQIVYEGIEKISK